VERGRSVRRKGHEEKGKKEAQRKTGEDKERKGQKDRKKEEHIK